jgi:tetratricopeptide (TPR) repeat protein
LIFVLFQNPYGTVMRAIAGMQSAGLPACGIQMRRVAPLNVSTLSRPRCPRLSQRHLKQHHVAMAAQKPPTIETDEPLETLPSTAKSSVETGLARFQAGDSEGALRLFLHALKQSPNDDEACAALYNAACAYTKLERWQEASDAVVKAVNDYNLKLVVALRDPDLEALRERREWIAALDRAAGGISSDAYIKLRAEAKSPFRLTRVLLFGALAAGAGLGLIITSTRVVTALQGGEDAPNLQATLQNFAINAAGLAGFGFLVLRDVQAGKREENVVAREEALATLQIKVGPGRVLPLAAFRGTTRPVIVTGTRGQVNKALREAEPLKSELRARGVSIIAIVLNEDDSGERLRRLREELAAEGTSSVDDGATSATASGKGGAKRTGGEQGSIPQGFGGTSNTASSSTSISKTKAQDADKRWQLEAFAVSEWEGWLKEQAREAGVLTAQLNYYVQVQLDGSVRASGVGNPPWSKLLDDLPKLDDVRTKLTDGMAAG